MGCTLAQRSEALGYSYEEVAAIVLKSQAACRRLAVRARRQLADGRPRYDASPREWDELAERSTAS